MKELGRLFFDCRISKGIIEWIGILFCYTLLPKQKCWSGVGAFHYLIQEQALNDQSTSPCKSVHLNGEYRYLQSLFPQKRLLICIFTYICQEIKSKGGGPD
jgi:hypothetical protein